MSKLVPILVLIAILMPLTACAQTRDPGCSEAEPPCMYATITHFGLPGLDGDAGRGDKFAHREWLIGNNRGRLNGWVASEQIHGKVIRVEP